MSKSMAGLSSKLAVSLTLAISLIFFASGVQAKQIPQSRAEVQLSFAPLVRDVAPAVVNIFTQATVSETRQVAPLFNDPFFKRFFGDLLPQQQTRQRKASSLGSGVIVDRDGTIVTNNHVIEGADQIKVVLHDRREFPAKLVLADPKTDLAVLTIDTGGERMPHVKMRDSDDVEVGDLVLAVGNPFGVGQTVTMGIVSALARTNVGITDYSFFIQTDASINPGNSGGALVGVDGKLIGINTAIFTNNKRGKTGGSVGIGFAVPSNMVATVLRAAEDGKVVRPWLGARTQEVTSEIASGLSLARPVGALISEIHPEGPAAKAGLRSGDVVTAIDGREILDPGALNYRIGTRAPGESVSVELLRGGRVLTANLGLQAPPQVPAPNVTELRGQHHFSGARVANLSPAFALEIGYDDMASGVVIVAVGNRTRANGIGLKPGDQIVRLAGRNIRNVRQLQAILSELPAAYKFSVKRDGKVLNGSIQQ